jgi:hypothetical protein
VALAVAGKVAWVDGDLCGLPAGGPKEGVETEVFVLAPCPGVGYLETVVCDLAPHVEVLVVDSWDALSVGYTPSERGRVLGRCADVAAQHHTTILITTKRWQNAETGLEWSVDDRLFHTYATLGLFFPRLRECEVLYSRCCQSGRSVLFDYPDRFRAQLTGGFAGHYPGT